MANATNDLDLDVLRRIQSDVADLKAGQAEIKSEIQARRGHQLAIQQDTHNLYATVSDVRARMERIEGRLDLTDA
jgi:predicted nuclease with TOPRIM domain